MTRATVFTTHKTQAVRLPKPIAFPADVKQIEVTVIGRSRLLTPVGLGWDEWFDNLEPFEDDFLADRAQGVAEERESW
jgi:antitoxin VapB